MSDTRTLSHAAPAPPDVEPEGSRLVTCPFCHTTHPSLTADALAAGGDWQCSRCGQRWDARRMATDAAYTAWVIGHDASR